MEHHLAVIGTAIGLFAATNIDDVFVLLGFFSDPKFKTRQVMLGQYMGITLLYAVSVTASLVSLVMPSSYIGLLGLFPIFIGAKKVWEMVKSRGSNEDDAEEHVPTAANRNNIFAVTAVTVANGGDNISIYTPLFAIRSGFDIALIGAVFAVMTMVWIVAAHWLTNHRTIGIPIRRYGHKIVPFVLIALGGIILHEAGSFAFLH